MSDFAGQYTCFAGVSCVAAGSLHEVALAARGAEHAQTDGPVLIFDDSTGELVDLDLRGSEADVIAQAVRPGAPARDEPEAETRGRGRPKLGVVAREVTLLPRHWEWLSAQPGGASVALRRLVEEARKANAGKDQLRQAQARAYRFMTALAGNMPGFEEASRALFAADRARFEAEASAWPDDVRLYATRLAFGDDAER